jgi:hypothetical protein
MALSSMVQVVIKIICGNWKFSDSDIIGRVFNLCCGCGGVGNLSYKDPHLEIFRFKS